MVTRKPLPGVSPVYGGGNYDTNPQQEDDPRSSWERSSNDGDDWNTSPAKAPPPPPTSQPPPPPVPGQDAGYQSVPASLRPRGAQHQNDESAFDAEPESRGGNNMEDVPDFLRPGGERKETNPFLRRKSPENSGADTPTEQMARLNVQNTGSSNPWASDVSQTPRSEPLANSGPQQPIIGQSPLAMNPVMPGGGTDLWSTGQNVQRKPSPGVPPKTPWDADKVDKIQTPLHPPIDTSSGAWTEQVSHNFQPSPVHGHPDKAPWNTEESPEQAPIPVRAPSADRDLWASEKHESSGNTVQPPSRAPPVPSPAVVSLTSDDDDVWDDARAQNGKAAERPPVVPPPGDFGDNSHVWDDLDLLDKGKGKAAEPTPVSAPQQLDDWNLIDAGDSSLGTSRPVEQAQDDDGPPLPPRPEGEGSGSRWMSPRPPVDAKAETYQIKNIQWHDAAVPAAQNPRVSPILVQNANGPCPLVALVNALSLTTPSDVNDSALVEVLRSREQISLNLLLDAVLEELMSPRRANEEGLLPDIPDLYAFLQSLHTGMNVNPRYLPSAELVEAFERTSLTHLGPAERAQYIPGTFENTQEMGLYATFQIPLIHGWLPSRDDPTCDALERCAASYEDAQNLLFREEELEDKLSNAGLTEAEQQLYQDVITIKSFLESSATQLTSWGIEVIAKAMRPGTFAILFRNDHFSTLYCHPHTKQLVTLVTDDGYRTTKEVVWESLVDINGERTQFLSGDFKVVTSVGGGSSSREFNDDHAGDWQTVQNKRGKGRGEEPAAPVASSQEQEDQDLALAMQLQEEEDQRHREEEARRRRENNLSAQVMEQQGRNQYSQPLIRPIGSRSSMSSGIAPARRSSNNLTVTNSAPAQPVRRPSGPQIVRPLVPPRRNVPPPQQDSGADAPPSYQESSQDPLYEPPPGHPNHPSTSPTSRTTTNTSFTSMLPQGQRLHGQTAAGLRATQGAGAPARDRDRDCVVM